jgi:hypothetical protein
LCIRCNGFFKKGKSAHERSGDEKPGQDAPAGLLFPGNTIFGAVFYSFMDLFISVIIQDQYLYIAGIIDLKGMGCHINTDLAENTVSHINNRFFHGNPLSI